MAAALTIRRLRPEEVDRVTSVLGVARLHQGDGFYLVAWDGDEPVGHAHLALTEPPELQDVEVREDRRREGIGTALTHAAEDEVRSRGGDVLRLTVSEKAPGPQALYRGLGYEPCGVPPKRVQGTIQLRTGPIEADDTLLTWEKRL